MVRSRVDKKGSIAVNAVIGDGGLADALKIVLEMNGRGMIGRRHDHVRVRIVHDVVIELVPLEVDVGLELEGCASVREGNASVSYTHLTLPTKRIV